MADLTPEQERRIGTLLQPKRSILVTNLGDITPRTAAFLWWPYLPLGKVVIVAGAPGNGKSQFAALMAGLATRGGFPGDVLEPSRVLMMCAEDDLEDTVVPRLLAVNADVRLVDTISVVTQYPGGLAANGLIRLPGDAEPVHAWARDNVNARLIILDPVASFFERKYSTFINQDVRDALGPLVAIAGTYGVTIVIVLHLNKSESKDFATRIAESHGFQAMARSVMALGPDPEDPEGERGSKKVIAITKANLVKPGRFGLRCEVRPVTLPGFTPPVETSELALTGKCDISADDLLMSSGERSVRIEAVGWLADFVGDRWVKVSDVRKAATSDGFSWRTIDRIRVEHGYQRAKQAGVKHGPWWMAAPTTTGGVPGSGVLGHLDEPRQPTTPETGTPQGADDPQGRQDTNPANGAKDAQDSQDRLDEYRKFEQRKLGERDDDDDA